MRRDLTVPTATAPPPALAVAGLIDGNAVDPGLQGRLAAAAPDRAEDAEEHFLGQVEGLIAVAEQVQGQLVDHALVPGNELRARSLLTGGAVLNERSLAIADLSPTECPESSLAFATIVSVRRTVVAVVLVAVAGVAGALAYSALANEREFERRMAEGDQAVAGDRHFQAIEAYSGAVALKPDSMLARLKRGAVYQNQNELDAALRDLREAVDLDPGALLAIELLGDVNTSLQRAERAIERYEAYVSLDERNARVHYKLGLARYRAGRVDTAAAALQQALNLDPALGDAHYVLGLVLRDQNKLPAARRSLEESARRLPAGQTAPREALAEVYALEGEHTKAINELETLAALDPTRADRLVAVGLAQARAGREDAAVTTLSRAVEHFPDVPQAYAALGHVWLASAQRRGDRIALNKALEALQQAARRSDASS